ncbi:MAG: hypothetical protein JO032_01530 [Alphaproteobacteria bacterium]|nr:hypothetical protein [Alphaproteobacteria bacterium]MBV9551449.1 hypothetical protein [Alphaproteobacteria bacterium]
MQNVFLLRRTWVLAAAVVFVGVGAHSLHPRELYNQMYPVETLKRDTFRLCSDADPAFIRAVRSDREACYDSMPHLIAVALGRVRPTDAIAAAALLDPSRQAELLMTLAAMPPRQPVVAPRSFDDTSWLRALSGGCAERQPAPVSYSGPVLPPPPSSRGSASLGTTVLGNLPPLPHADKGGVAARQQVPVIPLDRRGGAGAPGEPSGAQDPVAGAAPLPTPDIGDKDSPVIVPLAPARACGV